VQNCKVGYEATDENGIFLTGELRSRCGDSGTIEHLLTCTKSQCGRYPNFDYANAELAPNGKIPVPYGGELEIICKPDYMLDNTPYCKNDGNDAANCISPTTFSAGESGLKGAKVSAYARFEAIEEIGSSYTFPVSGTWGSVLVYVQKRGVKPEDQGTSVSITVTEVPKNSMRPGPGQTMVGPAFTFGPDGLRFAHDVGLAMSFDCPVNPPMTKSCEALYVGKKIQPFTFSTGAWRRIDYASGGLLQSMGSDRTIDFVQGIVYGQTRSFSTYTVISVDIAVTSPTTTPPPGGGGGGDQSPGGIRLEMEE
jgi:hypothetical protein